MATVAAVSMTGCQAWHAQPSVVEAVAARPDRIRVESVGRELILEDARTENDSLIGFEWIEKEGGRRVVLPLDGVSGVQTRGFDGMRTGLTVLVMGAAIVLPSITGDQ